MKPIKKLVLFAMCAALLCIAMASCVEKSDESEHLSEAAHETSSNGNEPSSKNNGETSGDTFMPVNKSAHIYYESAVYRQYELGKMISALRSDKKNIAATVNGETIYEEEVEILFIERQYYLDNSTRQMQILKETGNLSPESEQAFLDNLEKSKATKAKLLHGLIKSKLIASELTKNNIDIPIEEARKTAVENLENLKNTVDDFKDDQNEQGIEGMLSICDLKLRILFREHLNMTEEQYIEEIETETFRTLLRTNTHKKLLLEKEGLEEAEKTIRDEKYNDYVQIMFKHAEIIYYGEYKS